jgi:hypothetical protein
VTCHSKQQYHLKPPICTDTVNFTFSVCGHTSTKECHQNEKDIVCKQTVPFVFSEPSCKHSATRKCSQKEADIVCQEKVSYTFPGCGHSSLKKKSCSEQILWHCQECEGQRKARIKELEEKLKNSDGFQITNVDKKADSAEYFKYEDSVLRTIVPVHNWWPTITKIEKVTNWKLEKKYEEARGKMNGTFEDFKFHGTGDEGVQGIPKEGFRLGSKGMYGAGIYFATDSSKSAQEIYTKGSKKLLVCKVLIGKSMTVQGADRNLNLQSLKSKGFDSVLAPRNSQLTNGVRNDEYIIYDPDQAKVECIVHYQLRGHDVN